MAEIIDQQGRTHCVPTMSKANSALTLGIIGTALSGLGILGGGAMAVGRNSNQWNWNPSGPFYNGFLPGNYSQLTNEDVYIERKEAQNYLDITKQFYEGKLSNLRELTNGFFDAYKRDVDNSFSLYKYSRDNKDELIDKINEVDKKVDMIAAVRPYQDALINAKIDNVALVADFNLAKRTCRMIQGELVLPATPVVTGYPSYGVCGQSAAAASASK